VLCLWCYRLSGNVNQLSIQVDVLSNLVKAVKAGKYTDSLGVPHKVVVLGFSFGSFVTTTLVAAEPTIMDDAIFTGLGYLGTAFAPFLKAYQSRIASGQEPAKFGGLDTGVLTWVDVLANINTYFKEPNYEIDVAEYSEKTKQPYSVGELLSLQLGLGVAADAANFTGPVLVVSGEYDFFACAGYCRGFLEGNLTPLYSGAKSLEIAIHPDSGHSINYNKNATGAFNVIPSFLKTNGF
jgi:pimeloyl-ACP methyl ester carboxylesterase